MFLALDTAHFMVFRVFLWNLPAPSRRLGLIGEISLFFDWAYPAVLGYVLSQLFSPRDGPNSFSRISSVIFSASSATMRIRLIEAFAHLGDGSAGTFW